MATTLSLWQRFRHSRLKRSIEVEWADHYTPSILHRDGKLAQVTDINGYDWHLYDGRVVQVSDIVDAGSGKWLYKIYC